jgi:hypothetical protein
MVSTTAEDIDRLPPDQLFAAASAADDSDARRAAQRRIAALSSLRVARVVLGPSIADKLALLDEVGKSGGVPPTALPVVLAALGAPKRDDLRRALDRLRRERASVYGVVVTEAIGAFVRAIALDAEPRDVLAMVEWAAGDQLDDGDHVRPFVAAAVAVLERVPASGLDELRFASGMTELLAIGGAELAPLLDRWLAAPATGELAMRRMFDAHGVLQRRGADRRIVDWLAATWARTADKAALATSLGVATSQNGGIAARAWFVDWAWSRFVAHPDERAAIHRAFASWWDEVIERRNALPRRDRPGGASAVDHLRVWGAIDLGRWSAVIEEAARLAPVDEWAALVDAVFDIARAARGEDRMNGLVGACRIGHLVTNRVRERDAPIGLDPAVDQLVAHGRAVIDELRADGLEIDSLVASRIDDLETSIRLSLEARDKRVEAERRAAERAEEQRRRDEDQRRREEDQRRAQEEAQRRQAELAAALATSRPAPPPAAPSMFSMPRTEITSIDREPFFTGALPTLIDYARFMIRMRQVGDAMAVMAEHGLDPMQFSAVAQAWTQLITQRPELGQRFGALMMVAWE